MKKIERFFKDSFVYGLGTFLGKVFSFFLVPILTNLFTPEEFGKIELLLTISAFVGVFISMALEQAQSFYFYSDLFLVTN